MPQLARMNVNLKWSIISSIISVCSAIVPARLEQYLITCLVKIRNANRELTKLTPGLKNLNNLKMAFAIKIIKKLLSFTRLQKIKIVSSLAVMVWHKCLIYQFQPLPIMALKLQKLKLLINLIIRTCLILKRMKT